MALVSNSGVIEAKLWRLVLLVVPASMLILTLLILTAFWEISSGTTSPLIAGYGVVASLD